MKLSWASNIGGRDTNEDNLVFGNTDFSEGCLPLEHRMDSGRQWLDRPFLGGLADGLGGESEGGQASRIAVQRLLEAYEEGGEEHTLLLPESCISPDASTEENASICVEETEAAALSTEVPQNKPPAGRLYRAAQEAAAAVRYYFYRNGGSGGCTLAAATVEPVDDSARITWAAAGDSVIFLLHHGVLRRINQPENLYEEHLRRGLPTDPMERSILLNFLGSDRTTFQTGEFVLEHGDRLLLASDGVNFGPLALRLLLSCRWMDAEKLTSLAVRRSAHADNATALLIDME